MPTYEVTLAKIEHRSYKAIVEVELTDAEAAEDNEGIVEERAEAAGQELDAKDWEETTDERGNDCYIEARDIEEIDGAP